MHKTLKKSLLALTGFTVGFIGLKYLFRKDLANVELRLIDEMQIFAEYTGSFEGRRNKVYDANPSATVYEPTIGIGHYLGAPRSKKTFEDALEGVDYDSVKNGKIFLTDKQVNILFLADLKRHLEVAQRLVPDFKNFPLNGKKALVDMAYRGDLADSPKTRELLNKGRIREAAIEYANREEYLNAEINGMGGLKKRIESNRDLLLKCACSLATQRSSNR
ncbi:MAG: hypothetical protein AABX23_01450 [Nanoarchaeota archaeon]